MVPGVWRAVLLSFVVVVSSSRSRACVGVLVFLLASPRGPFALSRTDFGSKSPSDPLSADLRCIDFCFTPPLQPFYLLLHTPPPCLEPFRPRPSPWSSSARSWCAAPRPPLPPSAHPPAAAPPQRRHRPRAAPSSYGSHERGKGRIIGRPVGAVLRGCSCGAAPPSPLRRPPSPPRYRRGVGAGPLSDPTRPPF